MTDSLKISLAQLNPVVGDIAGNVAKISAARVAAAGEGAELVIGTELCITGYPPEDLILKNAFVRAAMDAVEALAAETADGGPGLIVGAPWFDDDGNRYNAAIVLDDGKVQTVRYKWDLPNYGVFDEKRIFKAGELPGPVNFRGVRLGLAVCEDMWTPDVCETLMESGAEILVVINGSPYERDKVDVRMNFAVARVTETELPLIYVNQVGGQDELVFDGGSFVLGADRRMVAASKQFVDDLTLTEWNRTNDGWTCTSDDMAEWIEGSERLYQAMVLGLRDYVNKNGFPGVVLGLSGGIDSGITAVVAVDALGADRVHCVMMPSPYTSEDSLVDALELAENLKVRYDSVGIGPAMSAFDEMLTEAFNEPAAGVTAENIQSRSRGLTLMAISNTTGAMLVTTGNKSEMSVGYATIYGDMAGGYSVIKDVYKTDVFKLCHWRNDHHPDGVEGPAGAVIPERMISKPPSAELRPDQKDEDSLPPYEVLDAILHGLIEEDLGGAELEDKGFEPATVQRIWRLLELSEYKRRQAPPGVKLTSRSFGRDRRYPITNAFRGKA
ncbi:MAG: NAD+ synthase [Rhodospirillaceae bacterium]|jgi:NAD+ synthase|nr:NAD+ synthase [Rhodospirillaceae bacterium]MBT5944058.1 NAD+ synthase [Rhodospirillaceae bacterium]MBT6402811.1 NAD+ synthase [Rhodospirillaceae bacterium]MBT6536011.1 NAD+ synthase [Rhodospirillaceae bacterium]MBT7362199.1 NAD+ synthase [Rhodospirillaceae bacterium]